MFYSLLALRIVNMSNVFRIGMGQPLHSLLNHVPIHTAQLFGGQCVFVVPETRIQCSFGSIIEGTMYTRLDCLVSLVGKGVHKDVIFTILRGR